MENEIYVSCHAPSLSLLLFETVRSVHDQKGLLIGEICKEVISEKTDENEMNREHRTTIYLEHCIPIKDSDFFSNVGNVNKQKLQKYLNQYSNKIVGWYSFRRNTRANSRTLREIIIHKSLIQSIQHVKPEYFVAAFMSASIGANSSTHTYNHIFTRFHTARAVFEPLKFKIYTMSDKLLTTNEYSMRNTFPTSKNFEDIINPTQENENPVMSILTINKAIGDYLKHINKQLQRAEKDRNDLELEIKNLKKRLSLDKPEDIKVMELEREPEGMGAQILRYNPNVNYNPSRKENPIKVIECISMPTVPHVPDEVQIRNNQRELSNSSQGLRNSKERGDGSPDSQENSHSSSYGQLSKLGHTDSDSLMQRCMEDGKNQKMSREASSDLDESEIQVKDLEGNKVTPGSIQLS